MSRATMPKPAHAPSAHGRSRRALMVVTATAIAFTAATTRGVLIARAADLSISCPGFSATEGTLTTPTVATLTDVDGTVASNFSATVTWGDGVMSTGTVTGAGSSYQITDTHTYAEEGTYGGFSVSVSDSDGTSGGPVNCATPIFVSDAPLGIPAPPAPAQFTGTGASAGSSLINFETGIGGVKNTTPQQQNGGFRTINWDGVKTDGTDTVAGPNSTTIIDAGKTVGLPVNRFRGSGIDLGADTAVSNAGFSDVNANVSGHFPAFSTPNTFAPFNTNTLTLNVVAPAPPSSATSVQGTRGFGAIFLDVDMANTTSIEYFSGSSSIGKYFVPTTGTTGQPSFLGELFTQPVVTRVVITLGTAQIFNFDGTTFSAGPGTEPTTDFVAMDDMVLAEPTSIAPVLQISAGTPFSGTVASFTDSDPNGNASDYTADVHWGDNSISRAGIAAGGSGQFLINGSHAFNAGTFNITVDVNDFGGATGGVRATVVAAPVPTTTSLSPGAATTTAGQSVTLTATVTPSSGSIPETGSVTFLDNGSILGSASLPGSSAGAATASITVNNLPAGTHSFTAGYAGDGRFLPSSSGPPASGIWLVGGDGGVFPLGDATGYGSTGATHLNQPVVGMAATPSGTGYWLVASDGGVFPFGGAGGFGSTGGTHLNKPVVGMASTRDGRGYWLVAADGGVFPFGNAGGLGSTGGIHLNQPIVGMAATPDGTGYWLVAADGGIFPFGHAGGFGSTGGIHLNHPIVGMSATRDGMGYWLVAADGGIFPFGDAVGYGSTGAMTLAKPIVGMAASRDGGGYWLVGADGAIFPFGDAPALAGLSSTPLTRPIVGVAPSHRPS